MRENRHGWLSRTRWKKQHSVTYNSNCAQSRIF